MPAVTLANNRDSAADSPERAQVEDDMESIITALRKLLVYLLSVTLVLTTSREAGFWSPQAEAQTSPSGSESKQASYSGQGAPLSTEEIDSLVSPIALYPDALVAQILGAATFPDQIAVANYWVQQNKSLTGSALMQAVDKQSWDASVKALTQFPTVLNNLAQNLSWTSQLGEAYHNQQSDVMSAVQFLRKQAQTAGNLKTTPQQTVTTQAQGGQQVIVIQPANPQVVYVPTYNPTVVYGAPYSPPGYSTADLVATGLLSFGAGMAVGAMMGGGGCCSWGWSSWNCNWHGGAVVYHGGAYYGNAGWHGGYYGGYNNRYNSNINNRYGNNNYSRNTNVSGNTVNVNRGNASNFDRGNTSGANSWNRSGSFNSDAAHGWGSQSSGSHSSAFSGWGSHADSGFGGGGWGSRSSSARGWNSRGGGGGWGGGGFHGGGGFRR
jgi:hypothetical protein